MGKAQAVREGRKPADGEWRSERPDEETGEQTHEEIGEHTGEQSGEETGEPTDEEIGEEIGAQTGWVVRNGSHVSVALRSGRRRLRWNQRDLARRAGLSQATIARLEAGADCRFSAVVSALSACGLELLAAPPAGAPSDWRVVPHPMDEGRDTAGHRLPAHLPAYDTEILPMYTLWKRMMRGEDMMAARLPHWLFAYEPWPVPPAPPDFDDVDG